jgi:hypothetical protein
MGPSWKIAVMGSAKAAAPPREYIPNFHAFSLSLVRAYTEVMRKMI